MDSDDRNEEQNNTSQDEGRQKELERIKKWIEERRNATKEQNFDNKVEEPKNPDNNTVSDADSDNDNENGELGTEEYEKVGQQSMNIKQSSEFPEKILDILRDRNYPQDKKEWIRNLPWKVVEPQTPSLEEVGRLLNESHYGMEDVKQNLLEHVALQLHLKCEHGTVLLLLGPPGVGKTSIAKTLAKVLNREFVKINLGSIGSSFELKGAVSSWKNAQPGFIVKALRQTHSLSPLILLDEIDKIGNDETHGGVSSALLEILDSDRTAFKDNFLEMEMDLSHVFFIATANRFNDIDPILRDRLEIIELPGYSINNKLFIAQNYILPRKLKAFNLDSALFNISEDALKYIIMQHSPELGVRKLESYISSICRKMVYQLLTGKCTSMIVERSMVIGLLGKPTILETPLLDKPEVGVVNTLGVMNDGHGMVFPIETSVVSGDGDIFYTGGFAESCEDVFEVVMTIIKTLGSNWGYPKSDFDNLDIHVHAYWPGIKKEGSSIGLAFFTAFLSALLNIQVRNDVAVTGELTLHGRLIPIGGVEQKIIAASQAGIKKVIFPSGNKVQIEAMDQALIDNIEIKLIDSLDELIEEAFVKNSHNET